TVLLLVGAPVQQPALPLGCDLPGHQAVPADLLADHNVLGHPAAEAAVLRRHQRAQVAELAELAVEVSGEARPPVRVVELRTVPLTEASQLGRCRLDPGGTLGIGLQRRVHRYS